MKQLALLLLLTSKLFSQTAILLDSNSYPDLGAQLTWTGQGPADIYGKVFQYKQDCTQIAWTDLDELATVGGNQYNHFPPADPQGWGGYWCYAVDIGNGPVPIHWPVAMGMKWYVNLYYMQPDCTGLIDPQQFQVQVTRNGVVMPQTEGTNPYRYAGFMRLKSTDVVNVTITLPDGKVLQFPHAFSIGGVPEVDDDAPYLVVEVNSDGSDSLCSVQTWNYMQKGVNNK